LALYPSTSAAAEVYALARRSSFAQIGYREMMTLDIEALAQVEPVGSETLHT
jgi:hypothetical protein